MPNPKTYDEIKKIVAATDYSDASMLAVDTAISEAHYSRGWLHVVHVTDPGLAGGVRDTRSDGSVIPMKDALEELQRTVAPRLLSHAELHDLAQPIQAICHLRAGDPGREIAQLAADVEADVVYVSTHGRTGLKRFVLGSVAERVVRLAPCPVVVMRPKSKAADDWASPEEVETQDVVIEPPCPACVTARRQSGGRQLWCDQHEHGLGRRHVYHYVPRTGQERVNEPLVVPQDARYS